MQAGNTCIDCHKGIAHNKVHDQLTDEELEQLEAPLPEHIRAIAPQWLALDAPQTTTEVADASAAVEAQPALAPVAPATGGADGVIDWSGITGRTVTLFYPGQSSMEWMLGRNHSGKRAFNSGDRCFDCHEKELVDIGRKIISGEKELGDGSMEPTLIPNKRGSFPVQVQTAHDDENLYMRFSWADSEHSNTGH